MLVSAQDFESGYSIVRDMSWMSQCSAKSTPPSKLSLSQAHWQAAGAPRRVSHFGGPGGVTRNLKLGRDCALAALPPSAG